jgi:polyprenyl-phospho-N-acetylgalactosaminyl synthase
VRSPSDDICLIIPVHNEVKVVGNVVENALPYFSNIVCVDDGSTDGSAEALTKLPVHLIKHPVNLGQGAALQTGLEYALGLPGVNYFVTFDADGQHRVEDALSLGKEIRKGEADVVLGSRFLAMGTNASSVKRLVLKLATWLGNSMSGTRLTDAHNGLRVFSRKFAEQLEITMPDMTHGTELVILIGRSGMKYKEIPVTIDYTEYSKAKGQSLWNSVNILFDLIVRYGIKRKRKA